MRLGASGDYAFRALELQRDGWTLSNECVGLIAYLYVVVAAGIDAEPVCALPMFRIRSAVVSYPYVHRAIHGCRVVPITRLHINQVYASGLTLELPINLPVAGHSEGRREPNGPGRSSAAAAGYSYCELSGVQEPTSGKGWAPGSGSSRPRHASRAIPSLSP